MTGLLVDAHALLWALADPDLLPSRVRDELSAGITPAFVSSASIWEIEIKRAVEVKPCFVEKIRSLTFVQIC